jgi:hypothetical protein
MPKVKDIGLGKHLDEWEQKRKKESRGVAPYKGVTPFC